MILKMNDTMKLHQNFGSIFTDDLNEHFVSRNIKYQEVHFGSFQLYMKEFFIK